MISWDCGSGFEVGSERSRGSRNGSNRGGRGRAGTWLRGVGRSSVGQRRHHGVQTFLQVVQAPRRADHEVPFDDGVDPQGQFVVAPDSRRREELLGFSDADGQRGPSRLPLLALMWVGISETDVGSCTPKALNTVAQGRAAHPGLTCPGPSPTLKGLHKSVSRKLASARPAKKYDCGGRLAETLMAGRCFFPAPTDSTHFSAINLSARSALRGLPVFFQAAQIEAEIPFAHVVATRVITADVAHFEEVRVFAAEVRTIVTGSQTPGHGRGQCQRECECWVAALIDMLVGRHSARGREAADVSWLGRPTRWATAAQRAKKEAADIDVRPDEVDGRGEASRSCRSSAPMRQLAYTCLGGRCPRSRRIEYLGRRAGSAIFLAVNRVSFVVYSVRQW